MAQVYEKFTDLEDKISGIVIEYENFYKKYGRHVEDVVKEIEPEVRANTFAKMPDSVRKWALEDWSPVLAAWYLSTLKPLPEAALRDQLSLKARRNILEASTDSQDEQVQPKKDETESPSGSGAQEKGDDDNDGGKNTEDEDSNSEGSGSEDGDKYIGSEYVDSGDVDSEDEDSEDEDSEDEDSEGEDSEDSEDARSTVTF
jgi:hypothetical protein